MISWTFFQHVLGYNETFPKVEIKLKRKSTLSPWITERNTRIIQKKAVLIRKVFEKLNFKKQSTE